jgi:glycosyltransferase involved in cell wall biosynthesis
LSQEKGVKTLIQAWTQWGGDAPELRIVGDGPLTKTLKSSKMGLPIKFLGLLTPEQAQDQIAKAKLLILPSEWFEGFPMVIAEAFAFGTPIAVSDIGPLPSIVQNWKNGLVFKPGDSVSLLKEIQKAWDEPGLLEKLGDEARKSFEQFYTAEANYKRLIEIYSMAIEVNRNRTKKI